MLEKDHNIKCTTFATVPLINHFCFNWKKCILSCNPFVLVRQSPWHCKLLLNIDSSGRWDFNAVVRLQSERLKKWSYILGGEQVNRPSARYTSLSPGPPAAPLTLEQHRTPGNLQAPAPAMCGQDGCWAVRRWGPVPALVCLCNLLLIKALGQLSLLLLPECAILPTTGFMKSKRELGLHFGLVSLLGVILLCKESIPEQQKKRKFSKI